MPLDTSTTYPLTKLRLDGRRWNELRLLQAQISTNPASSGSSYLCMGNTAIMCSVHGPAEGRRGDGAGGAAGSAEAIVEVDVNIAGFAGVDRKRRAAGSDRYFFFLSLYTTTTYEGHVLSVTDNPRALLRRYEQRSSRIYTPTSTRIAQSASTCRCSRRTDPSWPPPSTAARWLWSMPESPCRGYSVAARRA